MQKQTSSSHYEPTGSAAVRVRERPLHWFAILLSLLFMFLLVAESVAFVVLGAWHLAASRLQAVLMFSSDVYRRELAFGVLLIIVGTLGAVISIVGLLAVFSLRLFLLRTVSERERHANRCDTTTFVFRCYCVCGCCS
jgi:hypothetical protein